MKQSASSQIDQHNREIYLNRAAWNLKPTLRRSYREFYRSIKDELDNDIPGVIVEIGSGMGNIKEVIPHCITTDLFPNPWIEKVESIYSLSFQPDSISNLILFDVWHHLEYPANALQEASRVLATGGKLILMEPSMSLLGKFIYGRFHHEPLAFNQRINSSVADMSLPESNRYFAAQSSAHRVFICREIPDLLDGWQIQKIRRLCSFRYLGSGGFIGPKLYPDFAYSIMACFDKFLGLLPSVTSARTMIVLKKI